MKIAVIDLGSNAVRMTVAEVVDKKVNILKSYRENVRLSENMSDDMMLKPAPVERTLKALSGFKKELDLMGVTKTIAVATAAMRNAENKDVIVKPLLEMGIKLDIIEGLKEAYYDYMGVINTTDKKDAVIVDIGGASTELILVKDRKSLGMISLPIGAVTLTEKYIKDQDKPKSTTEAMAVICEMLNGVDFLKAAKGLEIVALGGTARSFGQVDLNKNEVKNGHEISRERIMEIIEKVDNMTVEQIRNEIAVEPKRADIIKGGFTIIKCLMEITDSNNLTVSRSGVREGVLYDLAR